MPSKLQNISSNAFTWHPQSIVETGADRGDKRHTTESIQSKSTRFIPDTCSVIALEQIQQCFEEHMEFCLFDASVVPTSTFKPKDTSTTFTQENNSHTAPCFQCMSSGSSAAPKLIRRTQASWLASFAINAQRFGVTPNDSYAIVGKLSHSLALYACIEAANLGADIHVLGECRPDHQLRAIASLESSILYATPTQLRLLCNQVDALVSPEGATQTSDKISTHASTKVDSQTSGKPTHTNQLKFQLRHIFSGGGKLDQRTLNMLKEHFPNAAIHEFYGATETSFITISDKQTPTGSVGQAYPHVQLQIHNATLQDQNSIGEILVKSPYLFQEYVTASINPAQWYDDFISVGEMGYLDDNGYLFLAGRQNRRVNISDQLVYPEEIETLLNEHSAVRLSAVVPIADEKRGHVLAAVVQTAGIETAITEAKNPSDLKQTLLNHVRNKLGSLRTPKVLIVVDQLPLLPSGKPDLIAVETLAGKISDASSVDS